jgi:hypothetical protein
MITLAQPYARYTSHKGATGCAKVRSIFGFPARLKNNAFYNY